MRVLALAHQYVPVRCAGAETMLHSMLRALAARGHEVDAALSMQGGTPYEIDGVRVWPHVGKHEVISRYRPDIMVAHLENSQRAAFLGNWNDIPVAVIHHNTFEITKQMPHIPQARVDICVVNSQWMADDLAAWHRARGLRAPRTVLVRPLVERADYETTPGDRVTLVNVKRLGSDMGLGAPMSKGSETFWGCARRMPKTRFLGVTGAYGIQQVEDLPNVEILPHTPAPAMRDAVYARTRVLLVPSSYESWGRVASEALCSGIPVIAQPTPGLKENLGDAGIFVDWRDIDGYVRALRSLAKPDLYARARARALIRAEEHQRMRAHDEGVWCAAIEQLGSRHHSLASLAR